VGKSKSSLILFYHLTSYVNIFHGPSISALLIWSGLKFCVTYYRLITNVNYDLSELLFLFMNEKLQVTKMCAIKRHEYWQAYLIIIRSRCAGKFIQKPCTLVSLKIFFENKHIAGLVLHLYIFAHLIYFKIKWWSEDDKFQFRELKILK
jgi:hypothetical protein